MGVGGGGRNWQELTTEAPGVTYVVQDLRGGKMTHKDQPRRPAGTPNGGQWAPAQHIEDEIMLAPRGVRPELIAEAREHPTDMDPEMLYGATEAEVDWLLEHGSGTHAVALSRRDDLTTDQYLRLLDHEMPLAARANAAMSMHPGVAARAAMDPEPQVRAYALVYGWDLDPEVKAALRADAEVVSAARHLGLDVGD